MEPSHFEPTYPMPVTTNTFVLRQKHRCDLKRRFALPALLISAILVLFHVLVQPTIDTPATEWLVTYVPRPVLTNVAIATLLYSVDYEATVMQLCQSLRHDDPAVHLVLLTTVETVHPALSCCWKTVKHIKPIDAPWLADGIRRLARVLTKMRLWELVEYQQVLFLDADMTVVDAESMVQLAKTPMEFGTVQAYYNGVLYDGPNGGLYVLRPSRDTFMSMVQLSEEVRRGDDQFITHEYFYRRRNNMTVIPARFNVLMGIERENIRLWQTLHSSAIAYHFLVGKPWQLPTAPSPYSLWWKHYEAASCGATGRPPLPTITPWNRIEVIGVYLDWLRWRMYRVN